MIIVSVYDYCHDYDEDNWRCPCFTRVPITSISTHEPPRIVRFTGLDMVLASLQVPKPFRGPRRAAKALQGWVAFRCAELSRLEGHKSSFRRFGSLLQSSFSGRKLHIETAKRTFTDCLKMGPLRSLTGPGERHSSRASTAGDLGSDRLRGYQARLGGPRSEVLQFNVQLRPASSRARWLSLGYVVSSYRLVLGSSRAVVMTSSASLTQMCYEPEPSSGFKAYGFGCEKQSKQINRLPRLTVYD